MNFIFSTIDNHIGYIAIGSLPMRRNFKSGCFVKDGSASEHDWTGVLKQ